MRLLHITATHLNSAGGIPVVLKELSEAQNKLPNFEARVLSINANVSQIYSKYFDFLGNESFESYINRYAPDLVIFHSFFYIEYIKLSRIIRSKDIIYCIQPHGSFGQNAMRKSKLKKDIATKTIFRNFLKKAKAYIFLNESEKENSAYRSEDDIIVPNAVSLNNIFPKMKSSMSPNTSFYYIGRFDINHKGLDILFDALDILEKQKQKIKFEFYGSGSDRELSYVNERISHYKYMNVENKGVLLGNKKAEILKNKVMVLTSRYEGLPMTILEALSYGNPCLVTQGTNMSDEIVDNGLGWRTLLDSQEIANNILKIRSYLATSNETLSISIFNYVKNNYSWDNIANISYQKLCKFV